MEALPATRRSNTGKPRCFSPTSSRSFPALATKACASIEDRRVTIAHAKGFSNLPTDFLCIAAMNPCPCGMLGHLKNRCRDTFLPQIHRYKQNFLAPCSIVSTCTSGKYLSYLTKSCVKSLHLETSSIVRAKVEEARSRRRKRNMQGKSNSHLTSNEVTKFCALNDASNALLKQAVETFGLSPRGYHRLLKCARTIADLAGSENVVEEHLLEAIAFRN